MLKKIIPILCAIAAGICFLCHKSPSHIETPEISIALDAQETSVVSDEQVTTPTNSSLRFVTVQNSITKKMLTYHKGIFSLTPTFELFVQDQPVKPGETIKVPIADNKLIITYAYNFMGHKKGKKSIEFEVNPDTEVCNVTFSWHQEPRISLSGAKSISVKEIY